MARCIISLLAILFLVSCSSVEISQPTIITPSPVNVTPFIPTETPTPLIDITGYLYFDRNGNGIRDNNEEPLPEIGVCVIIDGLDKICTVTDEKGGYIIRNIIINNEQASLSFVDPNADDPALAFRYINTWKGEKSIPAIDMDGISVPEQHLQDTKIVPIFEGIEVNQTNNSVGLMQGFLTMPFPSGTNYGVWTWFDLDPTEGAVMNWRGETSFRNYDNTYKIFDNHYGIDWLVPSGTSFIAPAPSVVSEIHTFPDETIITLEHPGTGLFTHYGHIDKSTLAVDVGDHLVRGQFIAKLTKAPSGPGDYPYPDMLHGQIQCCPQIQYPLIITELSDFYRSGLNTSYWTVDNDPQFFP